MVYFMAVLVQDSDWYTWKCTREEASDALGDPEMRDIMVCVSDSEWPVGGNCCMWCNALCGWAGRWERQEMVRVGALSVDPAGFLEIK